MKSRIWFIPLFILTCLIIAFGFQLPFLGYYLDDWPALHAYSTGGIERLQYYTLGEDRPLIFWTNWVGFKLLGFTPLHWQIWSLAWRFATSLLTWLVLCELFPRNRRETGIAAVLFSVYPIFQQQPTALTFSTHWLCFTFFMLSILLMLYAARLTRYYVLLTFFAVVFDLVQLMTIEYYVGLELLRPFILWIYLKNSQPLKSNRLLTVMKMWLPYLIGFGGYLFWRLKLMPFLGTDRNFPELFRDFFENPLLTLQRLGTIMLQSMIEGSLTTWHKTVQPDTIKFAPLANGLSWVVVPLVIMLGYICFGLLVRETEEDLDWAKTALWLGIIGMMLGFAPGWTIYGNIATSQGLYNDRYGLAAMPWAALTVISSVWLLLRKEKFRLFTLLLLISLATSQQFRNTTTYRHSWERQLDIYWQLKWRMPELKKPTAILGNGVLTLFMGSWADISAINQMYAPTDPNTYSPYWYVDAFGQSPFVEETPVVEIERKYLKYNGKLEEVQPVVIKSEDNHCVWVLTPDDKNNPYIPAALQPILALADYQRIIDTPDYYLRPDLFGKEPVHDWCYYYQRAELARQSKKWGVIYNLWEDATNSGLHPLHEVEYLPFIEAAVNVGDLDMAFELTQKAYFPTYIMHDFLCVRWSTFIKNASLEDKVLLDEMKQQVNEELECGGL